MGPRDRLLRASDRRATRRPRHPRHRRGQGEGGIAPSVPLRVVLDVSPLVDGRADAGIGRYVSQLTEALRQRDDLDLRMVRPRHPPLRDSWAVRWLNAQPRLALTALRQRPRLMHGMASDPIAAFPLHRQVVTVHDVIPWQPGRVPARTWTARYLALQRRRFRKCGAVIAVSDAVAREATEVLHLDARRIHVIGEGVGTVFQPEATAIDEGLRRDAGVLETGYILWVGSLRAHDPRKELDLLIAAVTAAFPERDHRVVFAGALGAESQRIARRAVAQGVDAVFTGYVDDHTLAALYRGAAALALPSHHEGFGLPALEAMATGCPPVVTEAGNLGLLVGDAGLVVPSASAGDLAEALRRIVSDEPLRRQLGAVGLHRAAGYRWDRVAEQTAAVYHNVAG